MGLLVFGQRDPNWYDDILLGGPDTIGAAGCLLCVNAMIAWDAYADTHYDPKHLNGLFRDRHDYVGSDLLTDQALSFIWSDRFSEERVNGYDPARVLAAVNSPDVYCYLGLAGPGTHFVLATGPNLIADPWTNKMGALSGYLSYGWHVTDMVFVTKHAVPQPPPPQPLPKPTPVPIPHWYVEDENDLVVVAPQDTLDAAKAAADFLAKDQPGHKFVVEDDKETEIYAAFAPLPHPVPIPTPDPAPSFAGTIQNLIVALLKSLLRK